MLAWLHSESLFVELSIFSESLIYLTFSISAKMALIFSIMRSIKTKMAGKDFKGYFCQYRALEERECS